MTSRKYNVNWLFSLWTYRLKVSVVTCTASNTMTSAIDRNEAPKTSSRNWLLIQTYVWWRHLICVRNIWRHWLWPAAILQVLFAEQQRLLVREKRGPVQHSRNMVYDKQTELDRPEVSTTNNHKSSQKNKLTGSHELLALGWPGSHLGAVFWQCSETPGEPMRWNEIRQRLARI